jgi:hypothetical protein
METAGADRIGSATGSDWRRMPDVIYGLMQLQVVLEEPHCDSLCATGWRVSNCTRAGRRVRLSPIAPIGLHDGVAILKDGAPADHRLLDGSCETVDDLGTAGATV